MLFFTMGYTFIKWRLVPENTVQLIHTPSLVWNTRQPNPGYCHCYLLYIPIYLFLLSILLYRWTHERIKSRGHRHHIQWPAAPETAARARPLPLLDKGIIQKITAVDPTVASTGNLLLFPSFFTPKRIPIVSSRPNSQCAGCLMAPPLPYHQPPRPPGPAIGTLNIRGGWGCGLAQDIWVVEHGGLDIMETIQTEACWNNRRGYGMRGAVARPSRAGVSQDDVGVGSQDRPNGWGS